MDIPDGVGGPEEYLRAKGIHGKIVSTVKPISAKTNMRGIALF